MHPALAPSCLLFLLAAAHLGAQVATEGRIPDSIGASEVAQLVGNDETKQGLEQAAARLQARLREDGYFLATVIVDKLKDGRMGLRVFPGVFDGQAAKVSGKGLRVSPALLQSMALPVTSSGEPVTADQLASVTRRINSLPGLAAKAQVGPGITEGTAQLTLGVAEDDARVYRLAVDNYGTQALGRNRATAKVEFNVDAGRFDARGTVSDADYVAAALGYRWAADTQGAVSRIGLSASRYTTAEATPIQGDVISLDGGRTSFVGVGAKGALKWVTDWSLRRTSATGLTSGARLDGAETASLTFGLEGDRKDGLFGGGTTLLAFSASGGYTRSDNALLEGGFTRYNYSVARFQRLPAGFLLGLNLGGQQSSSILETGEQFSIGGPSGVRAYTVNVATGNSAYLFSADLSRELKDLGAWGVLEGTVFFDQGKVTGDRFASTADATNLIKSAGLGLSLVDNSRFKASLIWARRIGTPTSIVGAEEKTSRVWVSAQLSY